MVSFRNTFVIVLVGLLTIARVASQPPCNPGDCEHGSCGPNNRCVCDAGYFGESCDIKAYELKSGRSIAPESDDDWFYLFYDIKETEDVAIRFYKDEKEKEDATIVVSIQDKDDSSLPDHSVEDKFYFEEEEKTLTLIFRSSLLNENMGKRIVVGVESDGDLEIEVLYRYNADGFGDSNRRLIAIFILAPIIVFILLGMYYFYKRRYVPLALQIQQQQEFRNQGNLKKEELRLHFPISPFETFQSPFQQTSCCICLDDFEQGAPCIQLYCQHIFHNQCIEAWLEKHIDCPDCRKPMTTETIKKHFESLKEIQNQSESEKDSRSQIVQQIHAREVMIERRKVTDETKPRDAAAAQEPEESKLLEIDFSPSNSPRN